MVSAEQGNIVFNVSSNTTWNIGTVSENWLSTNSAGSNVIVSFEENTSTTQRMAEITISTDAGGISEIFTLTQEGAVPYLEVSTNLIEIDAEDQDISFDITTNTDWNIDMTSIPSWLNNINPTSGSSNQQVDIHCDENIELTPRSTIVRVVSSGAGTQLVSVRQEGATVGLEEISHDDFRIYPNPTSGQLNIEFDPSLISTQGQIQLFDNYGRLLQKKTFTIDSNGNVFSTEVGHLSAAVYILEISIAGNLHTRKVVIAQ